MKTISEFQRYLSDNRIVTIALSVIVLVIALFFTELSVIILTGLFFLLLLRRKKSLQKTESLLSIVEKKNIDGETKVVLIEFTGKRYLVLSGKNYALRLDEEKNNG
ncbi:MAG: hypothetical protein N3B13_03630 [Deltaproteobacteria bacterium]|nr:hypothetical protein [Deltaproteobacteria bacterium]